MGTHLDVTECSKCGGKMFCDSQTKNPVVVRGTCYDCGYFFSDTVNEGQLTLAEVNRERADHDLPPLARLKLQKVGKEQTK